MTIEVFQTERDKEMYALGRKDEREALIAEIREKLLREFQKGYWTAQEAQHAIKQILKELEGE